ncbi:hypothetical protein ASJ81_08095 [Methanosarcina spelaei]|uniref:Uncharacterized protein n=1 Tax=Methanosarcina spelaei TaxID=1036679 RepID=A0A2A2HRD8_9EURY|nr:hypothetical protein ASJ81_08095 [Methanosarcina spelaei]
MERIIILSKFRNFKKRIYILAPGLQEESFGNNKVSRSLHPQSLKKTGCSKHLEKVRNLILTT